MLHSITPLGERSRDRNWHITATTYMVGSVTGGVLLGSLLGGAGGVVIGEDATTAMYVAVFSVLLVSVAVGAAMDTGWSGMRLPSPRRQVDQSWLRQYRGGICGLGYGFQLGVGISTVVVSSAIYLAVLVALLSASPVFGGAMLGTFGLVKASTILLVRHVTEPGHFCSLERQFASAEKPAARVARWLQGAAAIWLAAMLVLMVA